MREYWPSVYPEHPEYLSPAKDGETYCQGNFVFMGSNKSCRSGNGYVCTRADNHAGDHAAHCENEMFLSWSDSEGIHREGTKDDVACGHYPE